MKLSLSQMDTVFPKAGRTLPCKQTALYPVCLLQKCEFNMSTSLHKIGINMIASLSPVCHLLTCFIGKLAFLHRTISQNKSTPSRLTPCDPRLNGFTFGPRNHKFRLMPNLVLCEGMRTLVNHLSNHSSVISQQVVPV